MAKREPTFTPLPVWALADTRLTELDLRVLGAICRHDNRSLERGIGPGCYAAIETLAAEAGSVNRNSVSNAITHLVRLGRIIRDKHPHDRRKNAYRVVYGDADRTESISPTGEELEELSEKSRSPTGEQNSEIAHQLVSDFQKSLTDISRQTQQTLGKRPPKRHLREKTQEKRQTPTLRVGAPTRSVGVSRTRAHARAPTGVGDFLARVERELRKNPDAATAELHAQLERVIEDHDEFADPHGGRARRLLLRYFDDDEPEPDREPVEPMQGRTEA